VTVNIAPAERLTEEYLAHLKETVNATENPVNYLAIDPGKANGVCGYDEKFYLVFMLTIQAADMNLFVHQFDNIKTCIIEDFKLYPNKTRTQHYSDMETSRVIGRVESWAELKDVELVKQGATIKTTAYAWLGEKPLPKHNPKNHMMDAHAHFVYWAVRKGFINARDLLKRSGNRLES